jgi:quercetin dioxygenase-like cupin family protein
VNDQPPDPSAIAADWRARGFSCEVWTDPPGQVWADFVHAVDELVMIIDGEVEVELGGNIYRPEPGEELSIPAGAPHTVRNTGSATSHWLFGYRS